MPELRDAATLFFRIVEQYILLLTPALAALLFAAGRGISNLPVLASAAMAGLAAAAYTAFWMWFASPVIGYVFSLLAPLACAAYIVKRRDVLQREAHRLRLLALPAVVVLAGSLLVLSTGYLYGGIHGDARTGDARTPFTTASTRFSHQLPIDNEIPYIFADQLRQGRVSRPMFGDWHSSDRPPLQTGFALLLDPYIPKSKQMGYQVLGVSLQCLALFGLWVLLHGLQVNRRALALALAVTLLSGFFLVNSFYEWPKLLAATYMLLFSAFFLPRKGLDMLRTDKRIAALAGILLAFGMLAHGGSAFAALGIVLTLVFLRRKVPLKSLGWLALSFVTVFAPWVLYQKLYDPPGDRLLKWHLAGVVPVDSRSFPKVLLDAYRRASWREILAAREVNLQFLFDSEFEYWRDVKQFIEGVAGFGTQKSDPNGLAAKIRAMQFIKFLLSQGFLMFGPVFLLAGIGKRFRSPAWRASAVIWLYVLCTLSLWCLLLFRPKEAFIHQGTYVTVLLAFAGSVLAIWSVSPRFAALLSAVQIAFTFLVYGLFCRSNASPSAESAHWAMAVLAIAALVAIVTVLKRLAEPDQSDAGFPNSELRRVADSLPHGRGS